MKAKDWQRGGSRHLMRSAHSAVKNAIKSGKLVRPTKCDICPEPKGRIEAHHKDYDFPLAVDWLCQKCHMRIHACVWALYRSFKPPKIIVGFLPRGFPCYDTKQGKAAFLRAVTIQEYHNISPDPYYLLELQEWSEAVEGILATLPDRTRFVMSARFTGEAPATLQEVATELGCSRENVRCIEATAVRKLRQALQIFC